MQVDRQHLKREADKFEASIKAHNFDQEAQAVWKESSVDRKRALIDATMIQKFKYPQKADKFRRALQRAKSGDDLDRLAMNLMQYSHGDYVV